MTLVRFWRTVVHSWSMNCSISKSSEPINILKSLPELLTLDNRGLKKKTFEVYKWNKTEISTLEAKMKHTLIPFELKYYSPRTREQIWDRRFYTNDGAIQTDFQLIYPHRENNYGWYSSPYVKRLNVTKTCYLYNYSRCFNLKWEHTSLNRSKAVICDFEYARFN